MTAKEGGRPLDVKRRIGLARCCEPSFTNLGGAHMRKVTLAALAAVAAILLSAGIASAATGLRFNPTNTTFTLSNFTIGAALGADITCAITLNTSFHERTVKRFGTLLGTTSIAFATNRCSEGNAGLLVNGRRTTGAQGPYHLTYQTFGGTLPEIAWIDFKLNDVTFWVQLGSLECLTLGAADIDMSTTGFNPVDGVEVFGELLTLAGGGGLCTFSSADVDGSGTSSSSVTLTLF